LIYSSRTIARARPVLLAILVLGSLAFGSDAFARAWPKPEGYVSDFARIVDPASRDSIEALARELREKTGAELGRDRLDGIARGGVHDPGEIADVALGLWPRARGRIPRLPQEAEEQDREEGRPSSSDSS